MSNQVHAIVTQDIGSDSSIISKTVQYGIGYARFAKGNCTDYAASRRPDIFPSRHGKDRLFGGNAIQWYHNARVVGLQTGKRPEVGAIAVYARGRGASTIHNHVAIVEKVLDDNRIEITDMNYLGENVVTRRIVKSNLALGYIYVVKDSMDLDEKYSGEDNFNHNVANTTNPTLTQTGDLSASGMQISYVIHNNNQSDITESVGDMSSSTKTQEVSHHYRGDKILIEFHSGNTYRNSRISSTSGEIQDIGYTHYSYESISMNNTIFIGSMLELSG